MKKLLIHLGMGGHTAQILRMVDQLGNSFEYEYIIGNDDQTSEKKIKFPGKVHIMKNPRLMKDKSLITVFFKMFPATIDIIKILIKTKPNAIISAGPSMAIPMFWIAKIFRIKTIFIESWVRVHHKSHTGKLVYPVTDFFIVQWESMKKVYKKAIFTGRLS
jgi:beta-1,4-N-acetylglucosaminyltransferase